MQSAEVKPINMTPLCEFVVQKPRDGPQMYVSLNNTIDFQRRPMSTHCCDQVDGDQGLVTS